MQERQLTSIICALAGGLPAPVLVPPHPAAADRDLPDAPELPRCVAAGRRGIAFVLPRGRRWLPARRLARAWPFPIRSEPPRFAVPNSPPVETRQQPWSTHP